MRSFTLLAKMYALGVLSSYSRPRVSNDNPYSESLFRTLKYCPWWPENSFHTIDDARAWVSRFVNWYNLEHKHSRLKYVTPDERHRGLDMKILGARKSFYRLAHQQHPERWSKQLRNWDYIAEVHLNPEEEAAWRNFITTGDNYLEKCRELLFTPSQNTHITHFAGLNCSCISCRMRYGKGRK